MFRLKTYLLLIPILLACYALFGQRATHGMKLPLEFYSLESEIADDEIFHVYLKGEESDLRAVCAEFDWVFKRYTGQYAAVAIPKSNLIDLEEIDKVQAVHFQIGQGKPLLNESRVNTRIDKVHAGLAGLPSELNGSGVIVGIIDAGLDLNHPDFLDANGNTRVLDLWDQTLPTNEFPRIPIYGYGQVYDSADINDGLCPHEDQALYYGHGTNTTGIAVANGDFDEQYTGCAPAADIIVVSSNFFSFTWTSTVADAVHYIFARAEQHGRPCVINASIGNYFGSHDGKDLPTQDIETMISEESGRIMVCAAGNSGEADPYHLGYNTDADTSFTWFNIPSAASAGNGLIRFNMYGDTGDFESLNFSIGADRVTPSYKFEGNIPFDNIASCLNTSVTDSLISNSGNYLGLVSYWGQEFNGTYQVYVQVSNIDSINYRYGLHTTGSGRIDIWSTSSSSLGGNSSDMWYEGLPSISQYPAMSNYVLPDRKQQIVGNWACSDRVITVGNYTNRNEYVDVDESTVTYNLTPGEIASSSSSGPSRLGSLKPDVAAPGELTLTSGASFQIQSQLNNNQRDRVGVGGMHNRAGGTSSASPVVAGIAALFLEHCPNTGWEEFKNALNADAISDEYTGNTPNDTWGNGKADAINTLKYLSPKSSLNEGVKDFCDGESVTLGLNSLPSSFEWNTGETSETIEVNQSGQYYALLENDLGCMAYSDTATLIKRPKPQIPIMSIEGEIPACSNVGVSLSINEGFGGYEWTTGEHTSSISVYESMDVSCSVFNAYGCSSSSDTLMVLFHEWREDPEIVLQESDQLWLSKDTLPVSSYRWFFNGEIMPDEGDSVLNATSIGVYQGAFLDSNGCEWLSNELQLAVLGHHDVEANDIRIWPNPANAEIQIESNNVGEQWKIYSVTNSMVASGQIEGNPHKVNMSILPAGVYFVQIGGIDGNRFHKIIKN